MPTPVLETIIRTPPTIEHASREELGRLLCMKSANREMTTGNVTSTWNVPAVLATSAKDTRRSLQRCRSWQSTAPVTGKGRRVSCTQLVGGHSLCSCNTERWTGKPCANLTLPALRTCVKQIQASPFWNQSLCVQTAKKIQLMSYGGMVDVLRFIEDALGLVHLHRHLASIQGWSDEDEQLESADMEHLLLQLRQSLAQDLFYHVLHIAILNATMFAASWARGETGDAQCTTEFADNKRPLSTTWPWTIRPSLAVLWGVCWMFYDRNGDRSSAERLRREASWSLQEMPHQVFYDDASLAQFFPPSQDYPSFSDIPLDDNGLGHAGLRPDQARHPEHQIRCGDEATVAQPGSGLVSARSGTLPAHVSRRSMRIPVYSLSPLQRKPAVTEHGSSALANTYRAHIYQPAVQSYPTEQPWRPKAKTALHPRTGYISTTLPRFPAGQMISNYPLSSTGVDASVSDTWSVAQTSPHLKLDQAPISGYGNFVGNAFTANTALSFPRYARQEPGQQYVASSMGTEMGVASLPLIKPHHRDIDQNSGEMYPTHPAKRRRTSDTEARRHSTTTSERPSTPNMSDQDDDPSSPDPSDAQDFTIRRGYTFKRSGEPPKNDEGRYVCKVDDHCRNLVFDRKCEWGKHMDKHERPYRCDRPECSKLNGFTYSGGLLRHQREVHKMHGSTTKLFCSEPNCKRASGTGFTRKENLHEHLRRVHRRTSTAAPDTLSAKTSTPSPQTYVAKSHFTKPSVASLKRAYSDEDDVGEASDAKDDVRTLRQQIVNRDAIIRDQRDHIEKLEQELVSLGKTSIGGG